MSSKEILILALSGWKEPGRTGRFSSFSKMISQILRLTSSRERNSSMICFFSQSVNSSPFRLATPFRPFRFPRTDSTVVSNSSSSAVFSISLGILGPSVARRMLRLPLAASDSSRMAFLEVLRTETELASLLLGRAAVAECSNAAVTECSNFSCFSGCLRSEKSGRVCVLGWMAGSGCAVGAVSVAATIWYFFLQALLICPSRKSSSFSSSLPSARRRASLRLQSSHLLLKNMLVCMSSNRSFSSSFLRSIILFLICSSLVLALSSLSSFWAAISSSLYCSISSASLRWKCECSFPFSYSISPSRLDFVCWMLYRLLGFREADGWDESYGGAGREGYFCMQLYQYYCGTAAPAGAGVEDSLEQLRDGLEQLRDGPECPLRVRGVGAIIFNNKMHKSGAGPAESLLSPKQAEQRRLRAQALRKIDTEIDQILSLNLAQQSQYQDFARQLADIEHHYRTENQELREAVSALTARCDELNCLYLATREDLLAAKEELLEREGALERLTGQQAAREQEAAKLRAMVRNQEQLIDDYRKNLADELELERELMQATLQQERAKLEREFNHALLQMERLHEEKAKRAARELKAKDYQTECQQLRRYLQGKENQLPHPLKKSPSYNNKIASEYSTNDHDPRQPDHRHPQPDPRHNQPVFLP